MAHKKIKTSDTRKKVTLDCDETIWKAWFELIGEHGSVSKFLKDVSGYEDQELDSLSQLGIKST